MWAGSGIAESEERTLPRESGPSTDTPWGADVDEAPETAVEGLTEKRTRKLVECYCVPNLSAF